MSELSTMNIQGKDYDIVDKKSRKLISNLLNLSKQESSTLNVVRQGVLQLADSFNNIRQNEMSRRTNLAVDDVNSFPILKFNNDFSVLVDISIIIGNDLYSSQQIIKCYSGKIYRSILNSNCTIDCYVQNGIVKDNMNIPGLYLFFDVYYEKYDLRLNVLSYDGNSPKILIDEDKFSLEKYKNAIKLK